MDEPDDEPVVLTFDEAVAMLPDGEEIHTFRSSVPNLLVGAHWPRAELICYLRNSHIELSGPSATSMGHRIAAKERDEWLFIETREPSTTEAQGS
jgi:hypothetical protein